MSSCLEGRVAGRDALVKGTTDEGNLLVDVSLQSRNGVGKEQNTGTSSNTPEAQDGGPLESVGDGEVGEVRDSLVDWSGGVSLEREIFVREH